MRDFEYIDPNTLDDAVYLAGDLPWDKTGRRFIAGGQDLYGELKTGLVEAQGLLNLKRLGEPALHAIEATGAGNLYLGSLTTLATLAQLSGGAVETLLSQAAASVASPQIRSRATLGGNLCQRPRCLYYRRPELKCLKKGGDECFARSGHNKYNAILGGGPSYIVHPSDMAPALVALDAAVHLQTSRGPRTIALDDFFTLPESSDVTRENVLTTNEVVTGVTTRLPDGLAWRAVYHKFKEREGFDFALSAVALALGFDGDRVADARLVLGGVAPKPWVCGRAAQTLIGARKNQSASKVEQLAERVGQDALRGADPLEMNAYKLPLTKGLIQQALQHLLVS